MKLFINQAGTPDFDAGESLEAVQTLQLTAAETSGAAVPLRFVKFQNVNQLTVRTDPASLCGAPAMPASLCGAS